MESHPTTDHTGGGALPVEVHRHGNPGKAGLMAEAAFVARVRLPPRALLAPTDEGPFARHVVQEPDDMAALRDRLAARYPDDPAAERACDALERAASEPGGHVVVVDGDAVAVVRRGVECHFVGDGFLHAARIAYEVVATFPGASEELCVHAAACLVADLMSARSSLERAIEATLGMCLSASDEAFRPMSPRLECHVRAGATPTPPSSRTWSPFRPATSRGSATGARTGRAPTSAGSGGPTSRAGGSCRTATPGSPARGTGSASARR